MSTATPTAPPRVTWAPFLPFALAAVLLWLAGRRDWGDGGENVPYLGAAVAFLGLLPALRWKLRRHRHDEEAGAIPFFPAVGCLFALYFGFPVLLGDEFTTPTLQHDVASVEKSLWLALGGWIALLVGWGATAPFAGRVKPLVLHVDWGKARRRTPWLLGIGFAAVLARRTLPLPDGLVQPVRFLEMLFQAGIGILALSSFRGELKRDQNVLLWLLLVPLYLFLQVGIGSVAQLAYASIFLLFLAWGSGRRVPVVLLGVLGLALLLMRGHVHEFRQKTWGPEEHRIGVWDKSVLFVEVLVERMKSDGLAGSFRDAGERVKARVSHLSLFAHVVKLTPERVPYWDGESYRALPSTFVPRAIWPDKPTKTVGQDFGHRYYLLAPKDRTTAVNLPQLVELYANFGTAGVLCGMFALGLIYRLLHRWWNSPATGAGTLILACLLFSRLILIESDFTLVYGALLQNSLLLILVFRWLRPREGPAPRAAPTLVERTAP